MCLVCRGALEHMAPHNRRRTVPQAEVGGGAPGACYLVNSLDGVTPSHVRPAAVTPITIVV